MSMNTKKSGVFIFVLMSTVVFVRSLGLERLSGLEIVVSIPTVLGL